MIAPPLGRQFAALLAAVFLAGEARAASPEFRSLRPVGGRRGTEVTVDLTGARLGDAREILFYQPGISVKDLKTVHDTHVRATLVIAADAALGLHDLRLRTATGVSEHRTFSVGALPGGRRGRAQRRLRQAPGDRLRLGRQRLAQNEDVDYYAFDAKKGRPDHRRGRGGPARRGDRSTRTSRSSTPRRFELASSDDAALVWQDAVASVIAPEDGRYYVAVRESAYAGNVGCVYRLHVGDFPRPTALIPSGGKLGRDGRRPPGRRRPGRPVDRAQPARQAQPRVRRLRPRRPGRGPPAQRLPAQPVRQRRSRPSPTTTTPMPPGSARPWPSTA